MTRSALFAALILSFGATAASAFDQPPIQSPQDKACRDEAASKVFDTPDPQNLGAVAIGKTIYYACMAKADEAAKAPVKTAKRSPAREPKRS